MASVELETIHWDRVDSVFEEGGNSVSVPHYNYKIRETLGSSNLEVFVEEEDVGSGSSVTSPPVNGEEAAARVRGSSADSVGSSGGKYESGPRE